MKIMQQSFPYLALCLLIVLVAVSPVSASTSATITGRVTDQQELVVPGAQVQVTNILTNINYAGETNEDGLYRIPNLPPGEYRVIVQKDGFASIAKPGVELHVQDVITLNFAMQLGSVTQTITVEGGAPLLQVESAAVGTVVDRQFVENIPLNGRTFQSLISLTPGIVITPMLSIASGGSGQFTVNGQRSDANSFMVDGVSANIATSPGSFAGAQVSGNLPGLTAVGTTQSLVSVDAMQEFKVQTSTYSAEFGRQPGGQISIVTRSGTNEFHGSLFDYLRNDVLDANDWFANRAGLPKAKERQNDFGGTLGGPVLLPRYKGRNRTFFFFSYEGLRLRLPQFTLTNVPTLTLRQLAPAAVQPILNAFPQPNGPDLGNGLAEFSAGYSNPASLDATSIRIDHAIGQKWNLFGRYNRAPSENVVRPNINLAETLAIRLRAQTATLGITVGLTPRLSNELRLNYSVNRGSSTEQADNAFGATPISNDAVLPGQFASPTSSFSFILLFSGRTAVGLPQLTFLGLRQNQRQFNLVDNFSYGMGAHRLKFGVDYRRLTPFHAQNIYSLLAFYLSEQQVLSNSSPFGSVSASLAAHPIYTNFSAYVQDTWKVARRLTVDLGLRWDVNPAPGEANGNDPPAVTGINNLATMQLVPRSTPIWDTTYKNFGPRVGVAYQLTQQTGREMVLRGGFGVFYDTGNNQGSTVFGRFPFTASRTVSGLAFPLSQAQAAAPPLPDLSSLTPPFGTIIVFDPNLKLPYTMQWNVAVQQALGANQVVSVSYVGAAGRRLLQQRQLGLSAINPNFTTVLLTTNRATSDYNALQAQFQRRLSRGLQALVSYTWSHALDEDSTDNGTIVPVRGNASFDARHVFAAAMTYDIPTPVQNRLLNAVLGHWSLDTSVNARSALPVDLVARQVTNPADGTLAAVRPNVIPGVPLYVDDPSVPGNRRINASAFSIPPTGQFGNLGRNVVRGLGAWQVDFAVRRQFKLIEKLDLQFRAEAFNLFNHPNFGTIQTLLTATNFGQATNMLNQQLSGVGLSQLYQIGGPRSLQLALKVLF